MESALALFIRVYKRSHSVEMGICQLKRRGYNQPVTTYVLMQALGLTAVEADQRLIDSVAWQA
jgi:hypothetical protein